MATPINLEQCKHNPRHRNGSDAHKIEPVRVGVVDDIFTWPHASYPSQNNVGRLTSNPKERNDIWVHQVFPLDNLPKEELSVKSIWQIRKITVLTKHPCGDLLIKEGGRVDFLDLNF